METYKFKIKCTYNYYGYPQAIRHYEVVMDYAKIFLKYYGNQGYDIPIVEKSNQCNGYFWHLNTFLNAFYGKGLSRKLFQIREGDEYELTIDSYDEGKYELKKVD